MCLPKASQPFLPLLADAFDCDWQLDWSSLVEGIGTFLVR